MTGGKALRPGRTAFEILDPIEASEDSSTWSHWWTQSKPIRTVAEMHVTFSLLETRPPYVYHQVAEKARELSRLGMSASAIARILKTTDKTVSRALRYYQSDPKGNEPSA